MTARPIDLRRQPPKESGVRAKPEGDLTLKSTADSPRLFLSCYEKNIDRPGRTAFPHKWRLRNGRDDSVLLAVHHVGCLVGAPRELCINGVVPGAIPGSQVQCLTIKPGGAFVLDAVLREQAGIQARVLFAGLYDRFELWDPVRYSRYMDSQPSLSELLQRFGI